MVEAVRSLVKNRPGVSLDETLEQIADSDLVYFLVARNVVGVNYFFC